jgi:hypothetical protein
VFTDEDKRAFEDPERYNEFRRAVEQQLNVSLRIRASSIERTLTVPDQSSHQLILKGSPMQIETRKALIEDMTKKLAKKPWIAKHRKFKYASSKINLLTGFTCSHSKFSCVLPKAYT